MSEHRMKRILNRLTNLVDDTHALEHFSEYNLKRISIPVKRILNGALNNVHVSHQAI